jgi:hypothetical protein
MASLLQTPNVVEMHTAIPSEVEQALHAQVKTVNALLQHERERTELQREESNFNMWAAAITVAVLFSMMAFCLLLAGELAGEIWKLGFVAFGVLCTLTIPVTYEVGGRLRFAGDWKFWQPMEGGIRFVTFQFLAWTFFCFSIIFSAAPWILAVLYPKLVVQGLTVCAGASAVVSETMMVCSLLTYDRKGKKKGNTSQRHGGNVLRSDPPPPFSRFL